ncbi:chaoptin-like isoform X1 [Parasteatoda tepidariorum]|uniref:chaoptin-like isoform X1 n=1 Tax=Parasteatoda tepidariorum TaxID=114398 RepID=UPI0039BC9946
MIIFLLFLATVLSFNSTATKVEPCDFNPLCTCRKAHHEVVCRSVPFSIFPQMRRADIYKVTIIRSGISTLEGNQFLGTNVASLHLMYNNIVHISPNAFVGLESLLSTLDLSYNHLNRVPYEALRPLKNMQWLNLQGNSIDNYHDFKWSEMTFKPILNSLFLGGNHISIIKESVLTELSNLTILNLDGNYIYDVDVNSLPVSLSSLSLSNNILKKVPLHAIYKLRNLKFLYLSGNLLKRLPCPFVMWTAKLEKLDLSNNLIEYMPDCVFNGSFPIRELTLEFNFLRSLSARSFKKTKLERLSLANNRLSHIHSDSFSGIEVSLTHLDLSFNLLEEFPPALNDLKSLVHLSLKENYLKELGKEDLQGCRKTLEVLDLSGNALSFIPKAALEHQRNLIRLSLQDNFIAKIDQKDFGEWGKNLTTLSLASNKLTSIKEEVFVHLVKLRELNLSFNNIIYFDKNALYPLRKTLEVLELSSAFDYSFQNPDAITADLERVEWLLLDNNNLSKISSFCSKSSKRLKHLELSNNNIPEIPKGILVNSRHTIISIHLINNKISIIKSETFANLEHTSRISLIGNAISTVETNSFKNCSSLHTIVLSGNNIYSINVSAFANITRLSNLYIQDNYLESFSFDIIEGASAYLTINASNNFIQTLRPQNRTLQILKTRTLDLTYNKISNVSRTFFEPVSNFLTLLFLSHNQISHLQLGPLPELQILHLSHNHLLLIEFAFHKSCPKLQILHLDHNRISLLKKETFINMKSLRVLDMSHNKLLSLSENVFSGISLERLNLSRNYIKSFESSGINSAKNSLTSIDLSFNIITIMPNNVITLPNRIQALNLSSNRITHVSERSLHGLVHLLELDLSHNELKERVEDMSFTFVANLRLLNLRNCSLMNLPFLPLPYLTALSLRDNFFYNISQPTVKDLRQLRCLDVSGNFLQEIPTHLWISMGCLDDLDISNNPISFLHFDSFKGLEKLRCLDVRRLSLSRLDSRTLHILRFLTVFKTDSYPSVRSFRLQDLLSQASALQSVLIDIEEPVLSHQVQRAFGTKLRELVITGRNLERILPDAFAGLITHELTIKISNTAVTELPEGLLRYLTDIRYLTLDLRKNQLSSMKPGVLAEVTVKGVMTHQTQHITGGVFLEDNPWSCSCELLWMGDWMRRWLRETFRVHVLNVEASLYVNNVAKKATCSFKNNVTYSIVHLKESDVNCPKNSAKKTCLSFYNMLQIIVLYSFLCIHLKISLL